MTAGGSQFGPAAPPATAATPVASSLRAKVLGWVIAAGAEGITAAEGGVLLAREGGRRPDTNQRRRIVAGRLAELAVVGLVSNSGRRRAGEVVWVASTAAGGCTGLSKRGGIGDG